MEILPVIKLMEQDLEFNENESEEEVVNQSEEEEEEEVEKIIPKVEPKKIIPEEVAVAKKLRAHLNISK